MKRNLYFLIGVFVAGLSCAYLFVCGKNSNPLTCNDQQSPQRIRYQLNKMWRDGAAAEMEAIDGAIVHRYILSDKDYEKELKLKMQEEMAEIFAAKNDQEFMEEVGDLYEVIECEIARRKLDKKIIEQMQAAKRQKRGSYRNGEFITIAEVVPGSYLHNYYLRSPERHQPMID